MIFLKVINLLADLKNQGINWFHWTLTKQAALTQRNGKYCHEYDLEFDYENILAWTIIQLFKTIGL